MARPIEGCSRIAPLAELEQGKMDDFSDREMYEQAAANVVAFVVAADAFLTSRGIDPSELYRYFGESYADGWATRDVGRIAREVALNMTSGGFETATTVHGAEVVVRARWTDHHEEADWPTPVKRALERATPALFEAPMAHVGVSMKTSSSKEGIEIHLASLSDGS